MIKKSGCDASLEILTPPQLNHDLYIVMNELNKLLKMKTKRVMKNQIKNLSEYGLTDSNNMSNRKTILLNHLNENDLKGVIKIRRELKKYRVPSFGVFEMLCDQTINTEVKEFLEIVDDYLMKNYSNETNDFIEYEGETINKSNVVILVWKDEECRDEGWRYEMDGKDFESNDFDSLIERVKKYYDEEIKSKGGSIEIEIKEKPILHISSGSNDVWKEIE